MTVYHTTQTPFNPLSFELMGVSVKDGPDAIGKFGTGMKYAIAGILRLEGTISILAEGGKRSYTFGTTRRDFRGEVFDQITCNGSPLGFTTELGKHWLPWMFFRELHSNTLDEDGETSDKRPKGTAETLITVSHPDYDLAYFNRSAYFYTEDLPLLGEWAGGKLVEDPREAVFYRGVRVGDMKDLGIHLPGVSFLLSCANITEDRTLANPTTYASWAVETITTFSDEDAVKFFADLSLNRAIVPEHLWYESFIDFAAGLAARCPEVVFPEKLECLVQKKMADEKLSEEPNTEKQLKELNAALARISTRFLSCPPSYTVRFSRLSQAILGMCDFRTSTIHINEKLEDDPDELDATLVEEILHAVSCSQDYTRGFQTFSVRTIARLSAELNKRGEDESV